MDSRPIQSISRDVRVPYASFDAVFEKNTFGFRKGTAVFNRDTPFS